MTDKKTAFGIAIGAAAVLGIALFGAGKHFASTDQTTLKHSVAAPHITELPNPALSRIRLLVSNPN